MRIGESREPSLIPDFIESLSLFFCFNYFSIVYSHYYLQCSYLTKSVLITLINDFNMKASSLLDRLRSLADGKRIIELAPELNHITLDAIASVINY